MRTQILLCQVFDALTGKTEQIPIKKTIDKAQEFYEREKLKEQYSRKGCEVYFVVGEPKEKLILHPMFSQVALRIHKKICQSNLVKSSG